MHNSGPMEDISNAIIAIDRIYQLFPMKSEDFTGGFVHFAKNF